MPAKVTLPVAETTSGPSAGVVVGLIEAMSIGALGPEMETAAASGYLAWTEGFGPVTIVVSEPSRMFQQRYWVTQTPRMPARADVKERLHGRQIEMRWLEKNKVMLKRQYAGEWIVIERQTLISHSPDAATVLRQARAKGIHVPFLVRIPSKTEGPLAMEASHV